MPAMTAGKHTPQLVDRFNAFALASALRDLGFIVPRITLTDGTTEHEFQQNGPGIIGSDICTVCGVDRDDHGTFREMQNVADVPQHVAESERAANAAGTDRAMLVKRLRSVAPISEPHDPADGIEAWNWLVKQAHAAADEIERDMIAALRTTGD